MKASLDTNVIIHLYRAGQEGILFRHFKEGIYIYEQIRKVELKHHGQDLLEKIDNILFIDYLLGNLDEEEVVSRFCMINHVCSLNWSIESHLSRFIRRFWYDPYQAYEKEWMKRLCRENGIHAKDKFTRLRERINRNI